jgi:TRAP-type mannitol/chloroaromatic compound transport system permease small subunit
MQLLKIAGFIDKLSDISGKVLSYSLIPLTLVLVFEVTMRYGLNQPTIWAHETSGQIYAVCFFAGGAYALVHKAHVNVDILYSRFSIRFKAILDLCTATFMLSICWVFLWYGTELTLRSIRVLETSDSPFAPPLYPAKILIMLGMLLLTLQVLSKLIHDFYAALRGREYVVEKIEEAAVQEEE